ncbi:MAG TPA: hypothetical protein VHZ29_01610 [Rhizomicrobium sp.]|jgi:hypothetical protein|nr:hypothetical protein [Rhizomicrobium sp.]
MSEDASERDTAPPSAGIALGVAAADPALREDLRDYLRHQSQLARIQIADLEREDKVRHRSLRIHHAGDLLKLGFEIAAALVVLAAAAVIGAAVWSAAHDDGLVIEAFNVPSDMAANGLTGQVVATRIQDRLAWMQSRSGTIRAAGTYRNDWGDDIKVHIPNTGVSIGEFAHDVVATSTVTERALNAEAVGDCRAAIAAEGELSAQEDYSNSQTSTPLMMSADLAADHEISASRKASSDAKGEAAALRLASRVLSAFDLPPLSAYLRAAEMGDWKAARDDLARLSETPQAKSAGARAIMDVEIRPLLADAEARLGNFARAHALIDGSAPDCYLCTRVRGNVAAAQKDWNAAQRWYAKAASLGPSLPFADLDWARARLSKGDRDGAIAKLANANAKAPHFADPLELWGEALVARNRSDLALAKFAQAEKCAPNWGRLHLKWGEALTWLGDKDGARRQFAVARGLDLTKEERAELGSAKP